MGLFSSVKKILGGGSSSSGAATSAARSQDQILQEQWDFYKEQYLPTEIVVAKQATAAIPVDYLQARTTQDIGKAYDKQQGIAQRTAERYGTTAGTGDDPQTQMIRRAAEIGARNLIKSGSKDTELARMNAMAQLGQGIPAQALSGYSALTGMQGSLGLQKTEARDQLVNSLLGAVQTGAGAAGGGKSTTALDLGKLAWGAGKSGWSNMFGQQGSSAYNFTPQTQAYYGSMA